MTDKPHPFTVAFAALRSAIPNHVKAVNIYRRVFAAHGTSGGASETLFAFHDEHAKAEAALNAAEHGDFVEGVTFARGLLSPPTAWIVADHFDSEN
jgi:hypothetical protein